MTTLDPTRPAHEELAGFAKTVAFVVVSATAFLGALGLLSAFLY